VKKYVAVGYSKNNQQKRKEYGACFYNMRQLLPHVADILLNTPITGKLK
jgi:hypothetical protein